MASISILLTNRTTGVSSIAVVSSTSPPPPPVSSTASMSRSTSSSSPRSPMPSSSWLSRKFSIKAASLFSSTSTSSVEMPVWNLISSRPVLLVGSDTATNNRLPRWNTGIAWFDRISFSSTRSFGMASGSRAVMSRSGVPNSSDADVAIAFESTMLFCTR